MKVLQRIESIAKNLSSGNHEKLQPAYGGVFIILINSD